jgi:hypothetical protein
VSSVYQSRHQLSLLTDSTLAKGGEPVVATARVMWCIRIIRFGLTNEFVGHQPGQRPESVPGPSRIFPSVSWSTKPITAYPWLWPEANASKTWKPAVVSAGTPLVELTAVGYSPCRI